MGVCVAVASHYLQLTMGCIHTLLVVCNEEAIGTSSCWTSRNVEDPTSVRGVIQWGEAPFRAILILSENLLEVPTMQLPNGLTQTSYR